MITDRIRIVNEKDRAFLAALSKRVRAFTGLSNQAELDTACHSERDSFRADADFLAEIIQVCRASGGLKGVEYTTQASLYTGILVD